MILRGARVAVSPDQSERIDLWITGGRIRAMGTIPGRKGVNLSGYLILPGLINAHDHLEFNLFPRLGNGPYRNAGEWARDIHASYSAPIRKALAIPLSERLHWGAIKNLLSGVTTVCHHNPWNSTFSRRFPVRVVRNFDWAHSLEFDGNLQARHASCPRSRPFVFHAGEAKGASARAEMSALQKLRLFTGNSVMVHAVGLTRERLRIAIRRRCSVIWCPSSNLFTLGRTLSRRVLSSGLTLALGTDSTLTAEGDLTDELLVARQVSDLSAVRLYAMVTSGPAKALRLKNGEGAIREGGLADLAMFRDYGGTPAATLFEQRPEAVMLGGTLQMASGRFASGKAGAMRAGFKPLLVDGRRVYLRVPPPPVRAGMKLAGRKVVA